MFNFQTSKVNAGSLFFVITISLVIGALSSSLLLISYYHQNTISRSNLIRKLTLNAESGKTLLLNWQIPRSRALDTTIDLFESRSDSVHIQTRQWGLFTVGMVTAGKGSVTNHKAFLYGPGQEGINRQALYLSDYDSPLSISGNTSIRGNASLPAAGIRKGYIEGVKYSKDTLVYGVISKSGRSLPALEARWLDSYYSLLFNTRVSDAASGVLSKGRLFSDSVSFFESTRWIRSKDAVDLTNRHLKGNICIYSAKMILVDSTTILSDIILVAPVIIIHGHFSGSVQAFASDSLITDSYCKFSYPSSLVLLKKPGEKSQPLLKLGSHTQVTGIILNECKKQDLNLTQMIIETACDIQGFVYCNGYLQLAGAVSGTVMTDHFIYKTTATIYDTYLVDGQINRAALNSHFVGSSIFTDQPAVNRIARWLN